MINLDFQSIGAAGFKTEQSFVQEFWRLLLNELQTGLNIPEKVRAELSVICDKDKNKARLGELFDRLVWIG